MNNYQPPCNAVGAGGWVPPTTFNMQYPPPQQYYQPQMQNSHYQQNPTANYYNMNPRQQFHPKNQHSKPIKSVASCEICDRDFRTLQKYEEHVSEHVKCGYEGCKFEAHFKLMEFHKKNFHGKYSNKLKFDTPDDIEKWRQERRKNFPTLENVKQKKMLEAEREKSGNVLENNNSFPKRKGKGFKKTNKKWSNKKEIKRSSSQMMTTEVTLKVVPKPPPAAPKVDEEMEEGEIREEEENVVETTAKSSALSSILMNYNTASSEEEDETKDGETKVKSPPRQQHCNKTKQTRNGRCKKPNKRSQRQQLAPLNKKKSLLRKLLAKEITKERNEILQAVRFVVKNNFLKS